MVKDQPVKFKEGEHTEIAGLQQCAEDGLQPFDIRAGRHRS